MRIAAFSDVHSNSLALEAVLEDIERLGKDVQIVVAGDFLNCGPFPRETLALIETLPDPIIIAGNHEEYVLENFEANKNGPRSAPYRALFAPSYWTATQLSNKQLDWLKDLPRRSELAGPNGTLVKIVHGSPRQQTEGLYPELDESSLEDIFDGEMSDRCLWISGHTHRPFFSRWGGMTITNNGSVGMSLDGDNRACYMVAEWDEKWGDWQIEHRRVKYNVERVITATLANADYEQGGPFMRLMAYGLKYGRTCNIKNFLDDYVRAGDHPTPPDDFPHFEKAVEKHLVKFS